MLLSNIRRVMLGDDSALPDDALTAFMTHCSERIGDAYFRTPRNTVTTFVNMLSVLEQNPGVHWRGLIGEAELRQDRGDDIGSIEDGGADDELASFKL